MARAERMNVPTVPSLLRSMSWIAPNFSWVGVWGISLTVPCRLGCILLLPPLRRVGPLPFSEVIGRRIGIATFVLSLCLPLWTSLRTCWTLSLPLVALVGLLAIGLKFEREVDPSAPLPLIPRSTLLSAKSLPTRASRTILFALGLPSLELGRSVTNV